MRKMTFAMLVTMALAGATTLARSQVSVDFDRTYDYSTIKTFAIQLKTSWGNPLSEKRVLDEVEEVLVGKGWAKAGEDAADAMVMVHGATETKRRLNAMYSGGGWRFGAMGSGSIREEDYRVGTLVVDIFDARTKALLVRGSAQGELSASVEKNRKKVEKATTKMFKDFPPTTTKKR